MRVEVRIEYDDSIGSRQVDADTACPCAQNIYENVGIGLVELVHPLLTIDLLRGTILVPQKVSKKLCYMANKHTRRRYLICSPTRKSSIISSAIVNYVDLAT